MRFILSGGGTGGHVYPSLSVALALQREPAANPSFLYVGRADGIEKKLSERAQISFQAIEVGAIRGLSPMTAARNLTKLFGATSRTRAIIRDFKPDAIFATGGHVSAPVIWAGAAEHVPSVLYLPDLEPGWAVRATAPKATRIAVSFDEVVKFFPRGKTIVTGYPVRPEFRLANRAAARRKFQLAADVPLLTVFGGSRGAHRINETVSNHLSALARIAQLILITGGEDETWMKRVVMTMELQDRVRVFGYLDEDFAAALAAADVVVSRAGAATLGEFPALGLPSILVPYPYAGKHQERNARFLVERGAAIDISNDDLERELVPTVKRLFAAPEELERMGAAARALAAPNAAEKMAKMLNEIAV